MTKKGSITTQTKSLKEKGYDRNTYKQSCGQILSTIMDTARKEECKAYTLEKYPFIEKWKLKSFFSPRLIPKTSQLLPLQKQETSKKRKGSKQVSQKAHEDQDTKKIIDDSEQKIFYSSIDRIPLQCSFCSHCDIQQVGFVQFLNQFIARCSDHAV